MPLDRFINRKQKVAQYMEQSLEVQLRGYKLSHPQGSRSKTRDYTIR